MKAFFMIGRLIRIALILSLIILLLNRLFSRRQKQELHFWVKITAAALLLVSAAALLWHMMI
ncbi:protein MIGRI [Stenoxybacter acetivorans]|uniref:protein MIGRI n=1 Tax=Stenoxybacter acetivorans TaxID=422441 RepID=UPI0012EC3340|nr:hypothetical protein [Stenoxybacter acetivorans]